MNRYLFTESSKHVLRVNRNYWDFLSFLFFFVILFFLAHGFFDGVGVGVNVGQVRNHLAQKFGVSHQLLRICRFYDYFNI